MDRFLSEKEILGGIVPWGRTTLWRKVRAGEFPPPRALSENRKGWLESQCRNGSNPGPWPMRINQLRSRRHEEATVSSFFQNGVPK